MIINGIHIAPTSIKNSLEKISQYIENPSPHCFQIANLNTEIFEIALQDGVFKKILNKADIQIIDGVGIQLLLKIYAQPAGNRITGTDFMTLLCEYAEKNNKKVFFLGGENNVAEKNGKVLQKKFKGLRWESDPGLVNIKKFSVKENERIIHKIKTYKPAILFIAYGSPYQEKWIEDNRDKLAGVVCMGVGGAFKLISKDIPRAPIIFQKSGFEWLWRLFAEPGRIRKIPKHVHFLFYLLKQSLHHEK